MTPWVQGAPPHLHTQTSYAGTRDNTWQRVYMPATIIVAHGQQSPMLVYGQRFSAVGERVKEKSLFFQKIKIAAYSCKMVDFDKVKEHKIRLICTYMILKVLLIYWLCILIKILRLIPWKGMIWKLYKKNHVQLWISWPKVT